MTIEEFIAARLAEDEAAADAAGGDRWAYDTSEADPAANGEVYRPDSTREYSYGNGRTGHDYSYVTCDREGLTPAVDPIEGVHIARHDPARVLRQVAALRSLIALYRKRVEQGWGHHDADDMLADDLAPIAAIWSDHPDYRQEWAL